MRIPPILRSGQQWSRYNVASLAALNAAITPPASMPWLQGAFALGATSIFIDLRADGGGLGPKPYPIVGFDMAVETNELVREPEIQPIGINLKNQKIDILGSSLTLAAEVSLMMLWGSGPLPGYPPLRYHRATFTAVATGVPTAMGAGTTELPAEARRVKLVAVRGINIECASFQFGGAEKTGMIPGRNCSALADVIVPAEWYSVDVPVGGADTIICDAANVGATGTSDAFFGFTF